MVFGTELLQVSVGYIQINITQTCWLNGHIDVLRRRPLHKVFKISPIYLFMGNGRRIRFLVRFMVW